MIADFAGVTPFMLSAQSGDVSTVKYLLDHGGDLTKSDAKVRTVLHHAACTGSSPGPSPMQFVLYYHAYLCVRHYGYGYSNNIVEEEKL